MLTYYQLDLLADSYIPALFMISLWVLVLSVFAGGFKSKSIELASLLVAILIVYSVMFLDNAFKLWPLLGLDYSTHTALALVFVVYLSAKNKVLLLFSVLSFLLYVWLMLYQRYHSVADIVSTVVILLPLFWLLLHRKILTQAFRKRLRPAA